MIEVERKFSLENIDLEKFLKDAEFLGEVVLHDIYYDYSDYRFLKNKNYLRNRNGSFELKLTKSFGVREEIEELNKIEEYFGVSSLEDFVQSELLVVIDFKNYRKKYKKGELHIDIDETDFGYKMGEIEMLVESEEEVKDAEDKIYKFALENNLDISKISSKKKEYLKRFKPEIYKEVYEK